jgi:hypothetical protein
MDGSITTHLQALLSSHGGIDSEESLASIVKQLKATRERVRNECINLFGKNYAPFVQIFSFLNYNLEQAEKGNIESDEEEEEIIMEIDFEKEKEKQVIDEEVYRRFFDPPSDRIIRKILRMKQKFESLGFSTYKHEDLARTEDQQSFAETPVVAASQPPSITSPEFKEEQEAGISQRDINIVIDMVSGIADRLDVLSSPEDGRYLLAEQEKISFYDASANEWRPVRLFLITDILILASKKPKIATTFGTSKKPYNLEKLIKLSDIKLTSYEDNIRIQNAWRIDYNTNFFILQSDTAEQKTFWLNTIMEAKNTLLGRRRRKKSLSQSAIERTTSPAHQREKSQRLAPQVSQSIARYASAPMISKSLITQMQEWIDEINASIAVNDYDQCEILMDKLKDQLAKAPNSPETLKISLSFDASTEEFNTRLFGRLSNIASNVILNQGDINEIIRIKLVLEHRGKLEETQDTFLSARATALNSLLQQLLLGGGVLTFVNNYCYITSSILNETSSTFCKIFTPNTNFLFWLRIQIKEFAGTIGRVIFAKIKNPDFPQMEKCIDSACKYAKEISNNIGIDTLTEFKQALEPILGAFLFRVSRILLAELDEKLTKGEAEVHESFTSSFELVQKYTNYLNES